MKSIRDTLKTIRDITSALPAKINIAIIGGVAAILHGVERTTIDIDFCVYSDIISNSSSAAFFELLKQHLPKRFKSQFFQGSTIVVGHMDLMTEEEKSKTRELAARIGRDKKLTRLLSPPPEDEVRESPEEYLR